MNGWKSPVIEFMESVPEYPLVVVIYYKNRKAAFKYHLKAAFCDPSSTDVEQFYWGSSKDHSVKGG